jgi:hypothetical protein
MFYLFLEKIIIKITNKQVSKQTNISTGIYSFRSNDNTICVIDKAGKKSVRYCLSVECTSKFIKKVEVVTTFVTGGDWFKLKRQWRY